VFRFLASAIAAIFRPRALLIAENLCLRQQLLVLQRRHPRPRLNAMALGDSYLFDTAKVAILSSITDINTILYRQNVLSDCLLNAQIVRDMYQLAIEAIEGERKGSWGYLQYPAGILRRAVEVMLIFVSILKRLRVAADQHANKFASDGFSRLFVMLKEELSDEYFSAIEMHLRQLKFRHGVLKRRIE
jgi:hypothetical protein